MNRNSEEISPSVWISDPAQISFLSSSNASEIALKNQKSYFYVLMSNVGITPQNTHLWKKDLLLIVQVSVYICFNCAF